MLSSIDEVAQVLNDHSPLLDASLQLDFVTLFCDFEGILELLAGNVVELLVYLPREGVSGDNFSHQDMTLIYI